jgi:hypothetical protein
VNHGQYRERARKAAYDATRTESGRDAGRKRKARRDARKSPTRPDASREVPLSDENANENGRRSEIVIPPDFHKEVTKLFREYCPGLRLPKGWTPARIEQFNALVSERCEDGKQANTVEYWRSFCQEVSQSDFLSGRTNGSKGPFRKCILTWILKGDNFLKVIEGEYRSNYSNGGT